MDNGAFFYPRSPPPGTDSLAPRHRAGESEQPMPSAILLIIDDEPTNLSVLSMVLQPDYRVRVANSGARALEVVRIEPMPDLILLDVMMQDMDGYTVLGRLREDPATSHIPVIFVTALDDDANEEQGLRLGAVDYITKPIVPAVVRARVATQLELKSARDRLSDQNAWLETEIKRRLAENLLIQDASIHALGYLAETRDPETGDHIQRTQHYAHFLARRLAEHPGFADQLDDQAIALLTKSAPLHDIGKVGIPDNVLLKPGPLDEKEWAIMRRHTVLGGEAIEKAEQAVHQPVPFLAMAKSIARSHHERWDGSGYPDGLAGDAIPLPARIMTLADSFDAITSERIYQSARSAAEARRIIEAERGRQFDPQVVDAFLACFQDFTRIAENRVRQPVLSEG
jgi:putative two-component system response regulator